MNRPPLAAFLDNSITRPNDGAEGTVADTLRGLQTVLADVIEVRGLEHVAGETDLDRAVLGSIAGRSSADAADSERSLTVATAAEVLAVESGFSAVEVRARIRDDLLIQMSRKPIDAASLAAKFGFADPATLREKIEGDRPLLLREYARLRVALDR